MCCYDTEENGRSDYTQRTLASLYSTVDWSKHRLVIVDNGSCHRTKDILTEFVLDITMRPLVITNTENKGTAKAINQGLALRRPEEMCVKCDNDVIIHRSGWVEEMEEAIDRAPGIGILGLKRKDVDFYGTYLGLPHVPGERWITVETGGQIMGTCTMFNWRLVDKIGGMKQVGVYGMDDCLYDLRSRLAGFWNAYLPHINIDHIDTGENPYTQEKHRQAGAVWQEYVKMHEDYVSGRRLLWEEFE